MRPIVFVNLEKMKNEFIYFTQINYFLSYYFLQFIAQKMSPRMEVCTDLTWSENNDAVSFLAVSLLSSGSHVIRTQCTYLAIHNTADCN